MAKHKETGFQSGDRYLLFGDEDELRYLPTIRYSWYHETTKAEGAEVVIYEPALQAIVFFCNRVIKNPAEFKVVCDVIIAYRQSEERTIVGIRIKQEIFRRD